MQGNVKNWNPDLNFRCSYTETSQTGIVAIMAGMIDLRSFPVQCLECQESVSNQLNNTMSIPNATMPHAVAQKLLNTTKGGIA